MTECWGGAPSRRQPTVADGLRLTRRGRRLLLLSALALGLVLALWAGRADSANETQQHVATETVVVEPGQTLWDIATDAAPDRDPREVVADIVDLNALSDAGSVRAGQSLFLPTY
ncbi:MAG: LysM peptidoglycan-binding domain-containing protein [Nocardioidaceae bacterium]|nr:LysM peptidoglycan-binding domain-containing protein [Nocardioidaceae bacterium]